MPLGIPEPMPIAEFEAWAAFSAAHESFIDRLRESLVWHHAVFNSFGKGQTELNKSQGPKSTAQDGQGGPEGAGLIR